MVDKERSNLPPLRSAILRAFTGVGFLKFYQMGFALFTSVILARTLGAEAYGAYTLILSLASLLALPAYVGLPPFLVREIAVYESGNSWSSIRGVVRWAHSVTFTVAVCISAVLLSASYLNADWTPGDKWTLLFIIAPAIPLLAIINVRKAILQGLRRIQSANLPELLVRPSVFLIIIIPLWFADEIYPASAMGAQVVAISATFVIAAYLAKQAQPAEYDQTPPRTDKRRWSRSLAPFSAIAAVSYLNTDLFIPLLGTLTGDEEIGFFRVSLSLAVLIAMPLTIAEPVIHPYVSRLYANGDHTRIKQLVFWAGVGVFCLSAPLVLAVTFLGNDLLVALYGQQYDEAYWPLVILASGFAVANLVGPSLVLLYATEFERDALVISLISLIITIVLSIAIIPSHGASGGAVSFAVGKVSRAVGFRAWANYRLRTASR